MRQIAVTYHHEDGAWWAEAPTAPGFSALATTRDELDRMVREGLEFHFDGEPVGVLRYDETGAALDARAAFAPSLRLDRSWWTITESDAVARAESQPQLVSRSRSVSISKSATTGASA